MEFGGIVTMTLGFIYMWFLLKLDREEREKDKRNCPEAIPLCSAVTCVCECCTQDSPVMIDENYVKDA